MVLVMDGTANGYIAGGPPDHNFSLFYAHARPVTRINQPRVNPQLMISRHPPTPSTRNQIPNACRSSAMGAQGARARAVPWKHEASTVCCSSPPSLATPSDMHLPAAGAAQAATRRTRRPARALQGDEYQQREGGGGARPCVFQNKTHTRRARGERARAGSSRRPCKAPTRRGGRD